MKHPLNRINVRIAWCRRQRQQARSEPESDQWRAEEDGLRDALLNKDHTDAYRLSHPDVLDRYVMGFEDGRALLQTARVEHGLQAQTHTHDPRSIDLEQHCPVGS